MSAGQARLGLPLATVHNYLHGYSRRGRVDEWARELITFSLGEEVYAIELTKVREIVTQRPVTEVPRTPPFLLGVVALRGQIVPLVDTRRRLGLPVVAPTRATRFLICAHAGEPFGLVVDRVHGVQRLSDEEIEHRPPALGRDADYLEGIGRPRSGGMVIVLDVAALLAFHVAKKSKEAGR